VIEVSWLGWSTFRLAVQGGPTVVLDPCVSPLLSDPHARLQDVSDADLLMVTHGHHEHLKDVPRLAETLPTVPLLAPAQVREYLVGIHGVDRARVSLAEPDRPLSWEGLRIVPRHFPHLPKNDVGGKLAILRRDNPVGATWLLLRYGPRIVRTWFAIREQPEFGPFLAYDIHVAGRRILFTCEAFTELIDPDEVARWRGDQPIDLAVVGVESGQESAAARLTDVLAARQSVCCAVHAPFERFYGKLAVRGEDWACGRADRQVWKPGSEIRIA
jgi:hypothetical protein